jgi:curved DNA-binding protein
MKFQDYYNTLGIPRGASADEIHRAYRKLARTYHPDVNKAAGAEEKFKAITEANEVLKDPEKRKLYDELGADWQNGQEFRPPPQWGSRVRANGGHQEFHFSGADGGADFSDFFRSVFGGAGMEDLMGHRARPQPAIQEIELPVTIAELYRGSKKEVQLQSYAPNRSGAGEKKIRTLRIAIPPGSVHGSVIRLSGQGPSETGGDRGGDLLLRIVVRPDDRFRIEDGSLVVAVPITPWEAILGESITVPLPDGSIKLRVPSGSQSGQRMRLRGKGLPEGKDSRGDCYVELSVVIPKVVSDRERELMKEIQSVSTFQPRTGQS